MYLAPEVRRLAAEQGRLVLSVVGMSNVGKTHYSSWLAALPSRDGLASWERICIDDLILAQLQTMETLSGLRNLNDVALWMGLPGSPGYKTRQCIYLDYEETVMTEVLDGLLTRLPGRNFLIDTTGSVVHTGVMDLLKARTMVVYFQSDETPETMLRRYLAHPKPVVFAGHTPALGTSPDALGPFYMSLLAERLTAYGQYADLGLLQRELKACSGAYEIQDLLLDTPAIRMSFQLTSPTT